MFPSHFVFVLLSLIPCLYHVLASNSSLMTRITLRLTTYTLTSPITTISPPLQEYLRYEMSGDGDYFSSMSGMDIIYVDPSTISSSFFSVYYINTIHEPDIIHAHGLAPSPIMDGVPYISALPILPGHAARYDYPLTRTGTYFLHSHFGLHHDQGMAIPLIIADSAPKDYPLHHDVSQAIDVVLFLEEFCPYAKNAGPDQNPTCFNTSLVYGFGENAYHTRRGKLNQTECHKRKPQAAQDVLYHHHLANKRTLDQPVNVKVKPGDIVRLRIISSAGMTNYRMTFGDLPATLVATDASWIIPTNITHMWIAPGQRLDILLYIPMDEKNNDGIFPIFAWEEGWRGAGRSGLIIYTTSAPPHDTYSIYARDHDAAGYMQDSMSLLTSFRAWTPQSERHIDQLYEVRLTGSNGFDSINEKSYQLPPRGSITPFQPNPRPLLVTLGDRVCLDIVNHNADPHPMHLHGHLFTITQYNHKDIHDGAYHDTVFVPGGDCNHVRICFDANNVGVHPFHCHMQYHLAAGMLTTIEYVTSSSLSPLYNSHLSYPTPPPATSDTSLFSTRTLVITSIILFALILFLQMLWFIKKWSLVSSYDPIDNVIHLSDRETRGNYQGRSSE